ncbi:MAG: hypothetical protein R3B72_25455 [Polyangiaceae bacterium]
MRLMLMTILASLLLTGCPEEKKPEGGDKAKSADTAAAAPTDGEKKEDKGEEGGW